MKRRIGKKAEIGGATGYIVDTSWAVTKKRLIKDRYIYIMLLPAFLATFIFSYTTMFGVIIAFQDFDIFKGFFGSEWVGLDNFRRIFSSSKFLTAIRNTLVVSLMNMILGYPLPIIMALLINELKDGWFKKVTQTVSYLPHFLSMMSVVGIVYMLFGRDGIVNDIAMFFGAEERVTFLAQQELFPWFLYGTTQWKETGWGTVIHLANLASINPELYEAASIDGATRMQKLRYITWPHMKPMIVVLMIFAMGNLFQSNFELVYGLQNPYIDFEVISTITYQTGIMGGEYSVSTALGLAEGLVALGLVLGTNWFSNKVNGSGLL